MIRGMMRSLEEQRRHEIEGVASLEGSGFEVRSAKQGIGLGIKESLSETRDLSTKIGRELGGGKREIMKGAGEEEERGLMLTLEEALEEAELEAVKTKTCSLEQVLEIAATDAQHPMVAAVWRDTAGAMGHADMMFPSSKVAALMIEDSVQPQAVGHALVLAANAGYINCVRRLRELQREHMSGSILVSRFNAFAFLKAAENGHQDVMRELLRPMMSASTAMMGYVVATQWRNRDPFVYPFVKPLANIPGKDWTTKLASTKSMLPAAGPIFCSDGWVLQGMPGVPEELHDFIRATYSIYLLWSAAVVAAANCHVEVFKVLLRQRALENTMLADSFHDTSAPKRSFDHDGKGIIIERAKMDTLMYQLVEELSTKNYHDGILYALWSHIQRGGRDSPRPETSRPRCVAQAINGLWEMQLEVPLLMMPVEHALQEEQPFRRYKQLTQLFGQRAKVNIQLTASVEALPNCLQVTVGIKHVRFKVENSRWDTECMGHFPCLVTLSVTPVTKEGTGVTMTNSSSNILVKVGKMERVQMGTNIGDGVTRGSSGGIGAAGMIGVTSTLKNTPWRFEQLPLKDERGGSFVWTLQSMKGVLFERSNPARMAERNSKWRFARRMPSNPMHELPFTSEGGVIFTNAQFDDTMMWRFPKHMEGKKMRWNIEGQIHSTYTTTRYFETRMASFCGDIEEPLKPLEVKDKNGNPKAPKPDSDGKPPKPDKADKVDKGDKPAKSQSMSAFTDSDYLEFLEFRKYKEKIRSQSLGSSQELAAKDMSGFVMPQKDILGNAVAIEITQRGNDRAQGHGSPSQSEIDESHATPVAYGSGNGVHRDVSDDESSLWGRRTATTTSSGNDDDDQYDRISTSSEEGINNVSARRIPALSVRTRSGNPTNLSR